MSYVAIAVVLALAVPASPAWAHVSLLEAEPQADSTVTVPVPEVRLVFSEPVRVEFTTVLVTGADDGSYATGEPVVVDTTVIQRIAPLPAGPVRVAWRTVARDGHPVEGEFRFTIASADGTKPESAEASQPAPEMTVAALGDEPSDADDADSGTRPLPWLAAAGLVSVVGAAILWLMIRRREATR